MLGRLKSIINRIRGNDTGEESKPEPKIFEELENEYRRFTLPDGRSMYIKKVVPLNQPGFFLVVDSKGNSHIVKMTSDKIIEEVKEIDANKTPGHTVVDNSIYA